MTLEKRPLNPLIIKELDKNVTNIVTKKFILDILDIERDPPSRGKAKAYEGALANALRSDAD